MTSENAKYQSQSPMCHVCDARMRAGLDLLPCERCLGDGTATKVVKNYRDRHGPPCQRCKEREGMTTLAAHALRAIGVLVGVSEREDWEEFSKETVKAVSGLANSKELRRNRYDQLLRFSTALIRGEDPGEPEGYDQVALKTEAMNRRPMTEAEERLVSAVVEKIDDTDFVGVPGSIRRAAYAVQEERKPPEPRPITPEELAVVEAAKRWMAACVGKPWDERPLATELFSALGNIK